MAAPYARAVLVALMLWAIPARAQRTIDARAAASRIERQTTSTPAVKVRFDDDTTGHSCAMVCSVLVGTTVGAVGGTAAYGSAVSKSHEEAIGGVAVVAVAVIGALIGALSGVVIDIVRSQF